MTLVSHLWQSTLCVGVAALLVAAARRSSARTRYGIWLLASVKFLVPLSLLVAAGNYVGQWTLPMTTSEVSGAVRWLDMARVSFAVRWLDQLSLWNVDVVAGAAGSGFPLGITGGGLLALALVWVAGIAALAVWRWRQWRRVSQLARTATRLEEGREADALRRVRRSSRRPRRIELLQCESNLEPGILGIFRPRLLWPAGLSERLSDVELDAILSHEARHVDRRDNLSALVQVVVETVFWFHPVVWWLGARLVNERERACDEDVLRMGADHESYAEAILKVCGFCLRAPMALVAGVGGSTLTTRIEWILGRPAAPSLAMSIRLLLGAAVIATFGTPLAAGVVGAYRGSVSQQDETQVYRPGKDVTQPKLVYEVKPSYTKEAMAEKIQGNLWLDAVVLESGEVGEVRVLQSLDQVHGLDDAAVKALKQWRFEPGTKDKKPVAVRIEVEMSFALR
jgi:bla regulator protein blaR1